MWRAHSNVFYYPIFKKYIGFNLQANPYSLKNTCFKLPTSFNALNYILRKTHFNALNFFPHFATNFVKDFGNQLNQGIWLKEAWGESFGSCLLYTSDAADDWLGV